MQNKSIYEIGDNLQSLAKKAKDWFDKNNKPIPKGARLWQAARIKQGEIPPGCGAGSLRRYNFNITEFISHITQDFDTYKKINYSPITENNISELIGLSWVSSEVSNKHKKVKTICNCCEREEILDYGTLQRMRERQAKYCRYCRNSGGKRKDLEYYNKFKDATILRFSTDTQRIIYSCNNCKAELERTMTHVTTTEYLVCEFCNPRANFGARHYTELGYFDSKIEYEAYKIILNYLPAAEIIRQKKYDELFSTGTKHTADFYLPKYNLVLEVTNRYNKLGTKYKETAEWKKSLSNTVHFAYSLKEVEDIVRPLSKDKGLTVEHS